MHKPHFNLQSSVSALVLLATYDSVPKPTFEEMIKKQIAALRKQLDETETKPSVLGYAPQESTPVASCELQHPSQAHDSQIPKSGGVADFGSFKRDIQNRAKTAVAYGRSFIA
jgi:hypothetical protein